MELLLYIKLYFRIVSQYLKVRMQYRIDFFISGIGIFLTSISGLLFFFVLFNTIPDLEGWSFDELMFMYGFFLLALSPLQICFDNIWNLRGHVTYGSFIKYYLRPINVMFYYMSEVFDIKGVIQFILGLIILITASNNLELTWGFSSVLFFAVNLLGGALVIISIMILATSTSFWVTNSFPLLSLIFKLKDFSPYPISIFNGFFQFLFTYIIPIGFIAFYPTQLFLKANSAGPFSYFVPLFVGIGLFCVSYFVWNKGLEHYSGTGT